MIYEWDWTEFFNREIEPPFEIDVDTPELCCRLLELPFNRGLEVIVSSVPQFDHQQWRSFVNKLNREHSHDMNADYWLLIGQLIQEYLIDVKHVLSCDIEQAIETIQSWLNQCDQVNQFSVIACLYHYAKQSLQARMMLSYLLQSSDLNAQQIQKVLAFYQSLTERQKQVALLVAQGLTNQEIAAILFLDARSVAEHLTNVFAKFQDTIQFSPDKHGTRYRMIHWLTQLLLQYPKLHNLSRENGVTNPCS